MSELGMPPGDPAALEDAAAAVGRYAVQVGDLAAATHRSAAGAVADGDWTGKASDAYTAWSGGMVRGVAGMEEPFAQVPRAVADYAAALRTAQHRVREHNDFHQQAAASGGPALTELTGLRAGAESALTELEYAAQEARQALNSVAETLDRVFDASGPFRAWLERVTGPWDASAADAILEVLTKKGEAGAEEAAKGAAWVRSEMPKELARTMNEILKDPLSKAASRADLGDPAYAELESAMDRWTRMRGAVQAYADDWTKPSLLARLLPGLRGLGGAAGAAGVVGGVYTMVSPPEYDHGSLRDVDRGAGFASILGGGAGLATAAGVDFSSLAVAGLSVGWVPGAGQVLAVGSGLYLSGDWAYHHTHWIAHTFDSARHTAAHYGDNIGNAVSSGISDITGG